MVLALQTLEVPAAEAAFPGSTISNNC
ncbi:class III lanthipeptide [Krasilnikovia sp. M28-CT-15]